MSRKKKNRGWTLINADKKKTNHEFHGYEKGWPGTLSKEMHHEVTEDTESFHSYLRVLRDFVVIRLCLM